MKNRCGHVGDGSRRGLGVFPAATILLLVLPLMFCSGPSAASQEISLVRTEFIPDVLPGSDGLRWPLGGYYLLVVRNTGVTSVNINDITLNGASVVEGLKRQGNLSSIWFGEDQSKASESVQKLVSAGEPIWYKIVPASIAAGELGFVLIKARSVPAEAVTVSITDTGGDVHTAAVTAEQSKIRVAYVGFGPKRDRLVVFVRKLTSEALTIGKVYFDEADITPQCNIVSGNFWADLGIVTGSLAKPLEDGSYHLLRVTTSQGAEAVDVVRARNDFYPTGIYGCGSKGSTPVERVLDFYRTLTNCYLNMSMAIIPDYSFRFFRVTRYGLELARRAGIFLQYGFNYGDPTEPSDRLAAWYLLDEIDLWDGVNVKSLPESRRLGCCAQVEVIDVMQEKTNDNPAARSWVQLDGWGQPNNYFVYARAADIPSGGDYYAGQAGKQPHAVYDAVNALRWASMPGPYNCLIYASREASFGHSRFPTCEEEKIMAYYGVAAGAKGQCYYAYNSDGKGDFGLEYNPNLLAAIGRINHTLQTLSPLLLQSYPAEGIVTRTSVSGQDNDSSLWHKTLLCADGSVILVLVNHNFTSNASGFNYRSLKNIQLILDSPPWAPLKQAVCVNGDGVSVLDGLTGGKSNGQVRLSIPELHVAEIVVLSVSEKTGQYLRARHHQLAKQRKERLEKLDSLLASTTARIARRKEQLGAQGIIFESGFEMAKGEDMGSWQPYSAYWTTDEKHSGEYSLAVGGLRTGQFSATMPISAGKRYRLEFFAKFSKVSTDEVLDGALQFMYPTGGLTGPVAIVAASKEGWQKASCEGIANEGTVAARVVFEKRSGTEVVYVDDVRIIEVKK